MTHTHRLRRTEIGWELSCLSDDGFEVITQEATSLEALLAASGGLLPTPDDSIQLIYYRQEAKP